MNEEPKKTVLGWSGSNDPQYEALKAQLKQQLERPSNLNVRERAARGSQQPLGNYDADKTVSYAGQHVQQYMQEQMMESDHLPTQQYTQQEQYEAQQQYAQVQQQPGLEQLYTQQAYEAGQVQQQYAHDQAAYQQYTQAQEQYAQQQAAYQQQLAQQQYDQQQQAAYQQYYDQAYYAQQAQAAAQAQQAPAQVQPEQPNALGTMAAKLQARAEKQKQKLEKALRKEGKSEARGIAGADATVGQSARRRFIKKTYTHLFFAIAAFAGLLFVFRTVEPFPTLLQPFVDFAVGGRWNWGVVLAAYAGVSLICDRWASHAKSRKMQYLGLGFYVLAEAVIFVPLLAVVTWKTAEIVARGGGEPNIVRDAALMTLGTFGFLTLSVLISKKDFSFLRSGLFAASGAAMTLIVLSLMFGFNLGLAFSVGMVILASGYILMQTSRILAHYDPESHVAASLALFSSIALMFWYMIRIVMRARD